MEHIEKLLQNETLTHLEKPLRAAAELLIACYASGGKVLICGNGGSASDSEHIAGELIKGFYKKRPLSEELRAKLNPAIAGRLQQGLPAISLVSHTSLMTAVINDIGADLIFAQQVIAFGNQGDILIGLSTSGNAENILNAMDAARAKGMQTVVLTGEKESAMSAAADLAIRVPATSTPDVQELHIKVYHALCAEIESHFFKE